VLVDFGLAGRKLRPGCGTAEYGAPEIWGLLGEGPHRAIPADVYAFACVAYEVLTARTLFEGGNEMALIAKHVSHDGRPDGVLELGRDRRLAPLSDVLAAALRRDPSERASIGSIRRALASLHNDLAGLAWPLAPAA
jgi:serine/threonine protein kinase